jgi:hypothetical protein
VYDSVKYDKLRLLESAKTLMFERKDVWEKDGK